jgi:glycosyltransferase involved in cell wall biosynthesis
MRVVIDARAATDHFPGIGRYVVNLSRAMARLVPDTPPCLLHAPDAGTGRLALPDLPKVACAASPFSLRQQWTVPHALHRMRATLYHSPYYLMPYWPGMPTVLTCYDVIPLLFPACFSARQRLIFRVAHHLALRAASVVLVISRTARDDLAHHLGINAAKVVITPLAAGEHFGPQPPERIETVRRTYRLPEKYVLYVGSNKPHKNLVTLVRAWAALGLLDHKTWLVIAGHWDARYPEAQQVAAQLEGGERIAFIGPVPEDDLPALYSGALCFVFPSLYEGFGLPVLEAMACGTPVACSGVSSLPEIAGDAALLFDPTNIELIAEVLARLLTDAALRAEHRECGLRRAACFSWDQTARQTLEVYRSCSHG